MTVDLWDGGPERCIEALLGLDSKPLARCTHDQGHDGPHRGNDFVWTDSKNGLHQSITVTPDLPPKPWKQTAQPGLWKHPRGVRVLRVDGGWLASNNGSGWNTDVLSVDKACAAALKPQASF